MAKKQNDLEQEARKAQSAQVKKLAKKRKVNSAQKTTSGAQGSKKRKAEIKDAAIVAALSVQKNDKQPKASSEKSDYGALKPIDFQKKEFELKLDNPSGESKKLEKQEKQEKAASAEGIGAQQDIEQNNRQQELGKERDKDKDKGIKVAHDVVQEEQSEVSSSVQKQQEEKVTSSHKYIAKSKNQDGDIKGSNSVKVEEEQKDSTIQKKADNQAKAKDGLESKGPVQDSKTLPKTGKRSAAGIANESDEDYNRGMLRLKRKKLETYIQEKPDSFIKETVGASRLTVGGEDLSSITADKVINSLQANSTVQIYDKMGAGGIHSTRAPNLEQQKQSANTKGGQSR